MGYMLADVREAERRIRERFPNVVFSKTDYGFGLGALIPGTSCAYIVCRPPIDSLGQSEIEPDVDRAIEFLEKQAAKNEPA